MTARKTGPHRKTGRPNGPPSVVVRLPVPIANLARRWATQPLPEGYQAVEGRTRLAVPLVSSVASCGFPSPADDYLDRALDFNELLIEHPAATFAVRIAGESMTGAGMYPNDLAIVDRSLTPTSGCIVLALIDGEFTIKRFCRVDGGIVLLAENPLFSNIEIVEETRLEIWGVIKRSIRMHEDR